MPQLKWPYKYGIVGLGMCLAVLATTVSPAVAKDTLPPTPGTPAPTNTVIKSQVKWSGSSDGKDAKPIASSDVNWTAPPCWYEPFYTPEEFDAYLMAKYTEAGQNGSDTVYDYYYQIRSEMEAIHYHKGDKGTWWLLVQNDRLPPGSPLCSASPSWQWIGPADPPTGPVITAEMLSKAAYGATKLPSRQVTLSPAAAGQKVNLPTFIKFDDPVDPVWVTAALPAVNLAATVVAVPSALHIDAGTQYADPQSCDYTFAKSGAAYQVDTSGAACNITYRKATTGGGGYTLRARITWTVSWTPTATPQIGAGQRLPDGYSTFDQPVAVQEIQAVGKPTS
ncbi:hypothetical protein [Streptomyces sp. RKAG293]|uniref:hypothetical protein n=1 Tax=Streptomyces sp. RKAG293 TaxID=2893403 RepID=UPI00203446B7|nr:hypothetical protein [Streptomyces sp. RKAG293]MCM2419976.1 hypothetical protein [Streptomyces sp. RKAG293]